MRGFPAFVGLGAGREVDISLPCFFFSSLPFGYICIICVHIVARSFLCL